MPIRQMRSQETVPDPFKFSGRRVQRGALLVFASVVICGCGTTPPVPQKPELPASADVSPTTGPATTQPAEIIATLTTTPPIRVSRADLDSLLYEAYGLRILFDVVELDLAKETARQQGITVTSQDIQIERDRILDGICRGDGDIPTPKSSYEELFNQFLTREHVTRAEFDVKIVQTDAYLRKIVSPMIAGKLPETALHRAFEQLYGAKRLIQNITLANQAEAQVAREMLKTKTFEEVASLMSIDTQNKDNGGLWQPFSMQSPRNVVPDVIKDTAFSMDKGQISDILLDGSAYHIIKVREAIPPKIVKFEDAKDDVRQQLETRLIADAMSKLREELRVKTQAQLRYDDPILKAQWDAEVARFNAKTDRSTAQQKLNDLSPHPTSAPVK